MASWLSKKIINYPILASWLSRKELSILYWLLDYLWKELSILYWVHDYLRKELSILYLLPDYLRKELSILYWLPDYLRKDLSILNWLSDNCWKELSILNWLPDYQRKRIMFPLLTSWLSQENSALSFLSCYVPELIFLCGGKKTPPPLQLGVCTIHWMTDQSVTWLIDCYRRVGVKDPNNSSTQTLSAFTVLRNYKCENQFIIPFTHRAGGRVKILNLSLI